MSKLTKALTASAAGGDKLYVEDVFSIYVYPGNNSTLTITNGIDLAGEGGMVWSKSRNTNDNNRVYDTERGTTNGLITNAINDQVAWGDFTSYNSDGYSLASGGLTSPLASNFVSWTFRKAKKFFDVVTYTGNGASSRTIAHSLESVPGMMTVKGASNFSGWRTYHTSLGATKYVQLQTTAAEATYNVWNDTTPTDSVFSISLDVNVSGVTYVAYLFASDAGGFGADGSENIIKCGSYTTDASEEATISLGWEPQYVMFKRTDANVGADWCIYDSMRGLAGGSAVGLGGGDALLEANTSDLETDTNRIAITADGFNVDNYGASRTYIYIAIRRPMKVPELASEVYNTITRTGTGAVANVTGLGFTPDFMTTFYTATSGQDKVVFDRLRGPSQYLATSSTSQEINVGTNGLISFDMDGFTTNANGYANNSGSAFVNNCFRRAPGFMDEVCYTGNGSSSGQVIKHNLVATPELIIIKGRSNNGRDWHTYVSSLGQSQALFLNAAGQVQANSALTGGTINSTQFELKVDFGNVNGSTETYVAYLFATLAGISKVGSYTGNAGYAVNVDCGFAAAARFIMIKRTDASGDWYYWDSVRGITAGNDPYLLLNTIAAEVTNTDYIDPLAAGFTVTSSAPAALNATGGNYIFLAIA